MDEWNLISRTHQVLARRMTDRTMWRLAFGCIIAAEVVMLLWFGRHQWYFFDEWHLVVERVVPKPDGPVELFQLLFRPDGEHVIGLPLTLFVVLVRWFGIGNYWPFVVVNILVRVGTLVLVDDVCRRLGARRMARLLAVATIAFFGAGYESLFAQSVMFAGFTLVFALLAIRASVNSDLAERRAGIVSAVWLTCSVLSSGYGFPVVVGVALFYLLTSRRLAAIVSLLVPPIVFMVVRVASGGDYAQQQPISTARVPLYIQYVQAGLAAVGDAITGLNVGLAAFIGLVAISLWLVTDNRLRSFIIAMVVAIVAFYFEASLSRSVFGAEQARVATRYTFFCGVLAILMLAAAWGQRRVESRWATIIALLVAVSFANNVSGLGDGSKYYADRMEVSRVRLALGLEIIARGVPFDAPDPEWAADLNGTRLRAVMDSPYDDEFMNEARACYRHWDDELTRGGVTADAATDTQRAALLVLMNEHSLGIGDPKATLDELVALAGDNAGGSGVFAQFQQTYVDLSSVSVSTPGFVPTTQRCG